MLLDPKIKLLKPNVSDDGKYIQYQLIITYSLEGSSGEIIKRLLKTFPLEVKQVQEALASDKPVNMLLLDSEGSGSALQDRYAGIILLDPSRIAIALANDTKDQHYLINWDTLEPFYNPVGEWLLDGLFKKTEYGYILVPAKELEDQLPEVLTYARMFTDSDKISWLVNEQPIQAKLKYI